VVKIIPHKAASPPHTESRTAQPYSQGSANVHPIYRNPKKWLPCNVPYVQGIGNICILSADHLNSSPHP